MEQQIFQRRKKKVDYAALQSPLSRIPGMNLVAVRVLLDQEIHDVVDLNGRSPECLFAEAQKSRPDLPEDMIGYLRLAVYFAENPEPDPGLLHHWKWM